MYFNQANLGLGLGLSLLAGTSLSQTLIANNKCPETVTLVFSNSAFENAQETLPTGFQFEVGLSGAGIGYT
jgi:hypothetical protein